MDEFYDVGKYMKNAFEFIGGKSGTNNIIYLNKPQDMRNFQFNFQMQGNISMMRILKKYVII